MTDDEITIAELAAAIEAALMQLCEESWKSSSGVGDRVAGIQVVRDGNVIQEWHDEP